MKGLVNRRYHLPSPDFMQNLLVTAMTGVTPRQFPLVLEMLVAPILVPVSAYLVGLFDSIAAKSADRRYEQALARVKSKSL